MKKKPTYSELEQRVFDLEKETLMRKQAEEALRASEQNYRDIFENANDLIQSITPDGRFLYVNRKWRETLGYGSEDLSTLRIWDIIHPDAVSHCKNVFQKIFSGETTGTLATVFIAKDGKLIAVEGNINCRFEDNKPVSTRGIFRDVTERKESEQLLRQQNTYLSALHETTVGLINRLNLDDLLETIITRACVLADTPHGFIYLYEPDRDELIVRASTGAYIEDLGFRIKPGEGISGKVWQTGEPMTVEDYHSWNGRVRDPRFDELRLVVAIPLKSEDQVTGVIGLGHFEKDKGLNEGQMAIMSRFAELASLALNNARLYEELHKQLRERERAEAALRESEERYRSFFHDDLSAAFITKPGGQIVACNPAFARMFGFETESDMKNIDLESIYPDPSHRDGFLDLLKKKKRIERHESVMQRIDGTLIHTVENTVGVFDEQDNLVEIRGYLMDVTEQKRLEYQLLQSQKMESIGTLAGGIAHDFNNLLMGIQGRTSLMLADADLSRPHAEHIKSIEDYIKRAADLTRQLLGFARGGKYEVKTTDLNSLIKNQHQLFGRTRKEINIHEKLDPNLWTVDVDRGQIEQMLLNIYVNAWQAMPGGGDLSIMTENFRVDEDYGKPYHAEPGKYIRISVADTGVGMEKKVRERIFDPFFTTREVGKGTGLGLASAYGIIKNHGGFIDVHSEPGKGATFEIYLPASEKTAVTEVKPKEVMVKGTETVLLVDDEEMIIDVGREIMEKLGYAVLVADSGKAAVDIYAKNRDRIDLVILDVIMPEMDGGATYDRLKKINPHIRVLLSSGYSIDGRAADILDRGCNGFIQKPFNIGELSERIREVLKKA